MEFLYTSFDQVPSYKGASTHILANCRALTGRYHVTLASLGETRLPSSPVFSHIPFPIRAGNYLLSGLAFRTRISELLRLRQFEAIQFRTPWEGLAAVRSGIPCVYELNGLPSIELPYSYPQATDRSLAILYEAEQECLERARAIVCHTPKTAQYILRERGIAENKIRIIPNGYDPAPDTAARHIRQGCLRLVYLGTLSAWQGLLWSLQAFRNFTGILTLDIYGPLRKNGIRELQRRIRKLKLDGTVRHCGTLPKYLLHETLSAYDIAFAPFMKDVRNAVQGCCPVKLLDYKCAGLPILTSQQKITEAFVSPPQDGFLFSPNSLRSLRESLAMIAGGAYDLPAMRYAAVRSLSRFQTWEEGGQQLLQVYENLEQSAA